MTAIDRAALIEAAVQAVMARPAIVHHFTETEAYARDDLDAALPVIARELLAPLRRSLSEFRDDDRYCSEWERGYNASERALSRLLDQIEAAMEGGK